MRKAGVIGHPIAHSKSPLIHTTWLKTHGIEGAYQTYDIAPETLSQGIERLVADGLIGFNVTLPHKQAVMALCDELSPEATAIGAVNMVTVLEDGRLHGHNTDAYGFAQNLDETYPDFDWKNKTVAVIGAGGAARAILYALAQKAVGDIRITNRTVESATKLARPYNAHVIEWDQRDDAVKGADLVINTTSLGMVGKDPLILSLHGLHPDRIVYDIVYTPFITPLLTTAQEHGLRIVTGIGMLLHQARPAFKRWFGVDPAVDKAIEQIILRHSP